MGDASIKLWMFPPQQRLATVAEHADPARSRRNAIEIEGAQQAIVPAGWITRAIQVGDVENLKPGVDD